MPTASTIKLAVLVAVFERVRQGALSLEERRSDPRRGARRRLGGDQGALAGTELTIRDLATTWSW